MEWSDNRSIDDMTFAAQIEDEAARTDAANKVRAIFRQCGCTTADDIALLGCTGLAAHGIDIETSRFVRSHMAGAGVGLTCFIGPERYCDVHETIGGLQEGQAQRHVEHAEKISRKLTVAEAFKVKLIERARRTQAKTPEGRAMAAGDMLSGREVPTDLGEVIPPPDPMDEALGAAVPAPTPAPVSTPVPAPQVPPAAPMSLPATHTCSQPPAQQFSFECPEHAQTVWSCRYCLAREIVKGPLVPQLLLGFAEEGVIVLAENLDDVDPNEVDAKIKALDEQDATAAAVFVKVARWTRGLHRS